MRDLILVSRKPIIIQIFTLVCKKLNISLKILPEAQLDHKVDIVVIDNEFIDDRFSILKSYSKLIGAISKEELSFDMANDFTIPLPFLPSSLQHILEQQIEILNKRSNSKMYISNIEVENEEYEENTTINDIEDDEEDANQAINYLDSLADDIADNMIEETDDSMVSCASINNGGILDGGELSKLEDMINDNPEKNNLSNEYIESNNNDDEQWTDLSSIIDQAIDEVNTVNNIYDKYDKKPIKLLLNNYDIEQLSPLLNMLDQNVIDTLTEGCEVNLQLKLGDK